MGPGSRFAWPGRRRERCASRICYVISSRCCRRCFGCRMNLRVRENPWRLMLAVNVAVLIGVFLYKIGREPYVPYIHLLVDYHFGFTKRVDRRDRVAVFLRRAGVAGI